MDWKTRIPTLIIWLALVFSSLEDVNAEQRIVCYYTNWSVYRPGTAKFSPQNINPYLCTHLIYAFGGFTKENTLKPFDKYQDIEKGGYAKFTGLKTYNKNLKTMLAIGGWNEGSSRFSPMVADPGRRKEFVKNSVKFLRQNHFDGLDLDWEYPAFRDGGKPRDRNNYADLVQELREEFERESSKTGRPRLLLSMAVPAGIEYIDKGYDIPRLNDYLDFINLLSYDYHSAFEPAVNHHAPLYPLEEDNEYNYDTELTIDYTIEHLLKSGASSEKIVLGIPTYGRSYTLFNEEATEIGAPADGPGEEGDATREKGYLAYYEICESVGKSDEWEVVQPNPSAMGPYAFREKQWVGYDDEDIVRAKARYVNEKNLGGIMFWSIDNDDFRGKCHGRPYPLIEAAKEALLAGNGKSSSSGTKLSDRKKTRTQSGQRIQGNTIGRKLNPSNRRTTTQTSISRRKIGSSRSNSRSNSRRGNVDDDDDDEDEEETNSVKSVDNTRTRNRNKSRSKNRSASGGRRKNQQNSRRGQDKEAETTNEESLSNKLTTPEPPTTPDPGSDFKCEDEGFFPHPRDCKKYFWCLDSGPSGLGIVGHQFTCPSGLVFNKAADSCDYPRNVVCPKPNATPSVVTTTKAPRTTSTSRTTNSYKSPKRTTTSKPESEEEYEYYDDEEDDDESEEIEEEPRSTTTARPLLYKTINRSRPTTTTTVTPVTTTETTVAASTKTYKTTPERVTSFEDEEDPRVIKELIDLIRKAGGIEQLEKQLIYQEKNSGGNSGTTEVNGRSTPATISRSLYERVLNRQATRNAGGFLGTLSTTTQSTNGDKSDRGVTKNARIGFVNGPGGAQFEGLDNVPEVKSLRRTNKPKYVTIERNRAPTSESPNEDEEDEIDDAVDDDNTDVASSEDQAVSDRPHRKSSDRRPTPNYVNIHRSRPSTTTSENDVEVKDEDANDNSEEEENAVPRHRHRVAEHEEQSSSPKSRYTNVQRFRSTTSRNSEVNQAEDVAQNVFTTESTTSPTTTTTTTTTTTEKEITTTEEIPETTSESSSSTSENISSSLESTTFETTSDSSLQLVEDSATEILFTTAAASSSSSSSGSSLEPITKGPNIAAALQPRPFGFPRRGRPTTPTSSLSPVTEQTRTKVVSETFGLPTLKELVGYTPTQTESIVNLTTFDLNELRNKKIELKDSKDKNQTADKRESEKEIYDNDILGSEEIQHRSSSSSFVTETQYSGNSINEEKFNNEESNRRIEVPVKILDDTDGEEIGELVILRVPESKLNSAILKPVFRVKVLEQDDKYKKNVNKTEGNLDGISSENELDDHITYSRRRRIRVNSSTPSIDTKDLKSKKNRNRQRIVKARRRTRIRDPPTNNQENDKNITMEYSTESSTDVKATTFKGNRPIPTKSSVVRGFYVTKSMFETSTTPEVVPTNFTSSQFDETTTDFKSDFSTEVPYVADESSTYESLGTTLEELENTTKNDNDSSSYIGLSVAETGTPESISTIGDRTTEFSTLSASIKTENDIVTSEKISTFAGESLETVTPQLISTIDERLSESSTFGTTTINEDDTSERSHMTSFEASTSEIEAPTNPSTLKESTTEYSTFNDETLMTKFDQTTEISKTLETSEMSRSRSFPSVEIKTTTLSSTKRSDDDNFTVAWRTKHPIRKTTIASEQTTNYKDPIKRGRVRFTTVANTNASHQEHSKNNTRIEAEETSTKSDKSIENTENSYTTLRSRDYRRKTTNSVIYTTEKELSTLNENPIETTVTNSPYTGSLQKTTLPIYTDFTSISSETENIFTPSSAEINDETIYYTSERPETKKIDTNLFETTGNESSDREQKTTESLDFESSSIDSETESILTTKWTEAYDETLDYATPEARKISTNLIERTNSDSDYKTTKFLDSYSTSIDSGTEKISTSFTESQDKKIDYTTPEVTTISTNSIETGSDIFNENEQKTTKSLEESDITIGYTIDKDSTTNPTGSYEETLGYASTTSGYTTDNVSTYYGSNSVVETSSEEIDKLASTTDSSDKKTEKLEMSEETETRKNVQETTENLPEITKSHLYIERNRITNTTEESKTESINISNDITEKSPTAEVYKNTESNDAEITTSTTLARKFYRKPRPTTTMIPTEMKNIESTTEKFYSTHSNFNNERATISRQNERKTYTTVDSSTNTIKPVTNQETKRNRGRVRFTNFAAITDDSGVNSRPVKQVVVRRRLATDSKNRQRTTDKPSTILPKETQKPSRNTRVTVEKKILNQEKNVSTRIPEVIETSKKENKSKTEDTKNSKNFDQLTDEKINSTKAMRRRVVVYRGRPRAEIIPSTSTMQSLRESSENSNESERTRRRKWRKRIVLKKRARTDEADDQSIAETSDFRRAIIDDTFINLRDIGSSIKDEEPSNVDTGREVKLYKGSGSFLRRPGTQLRGNGTNRTKNKSQGNSVPSASVFSKIQTTAEETKSDDQSGRAQELAVTLADPPSVRSSVTTSRLQFRTTSSTRKISTTIAPRTEAPTRKTTSIVRRRQKPKGNSNSDRIIENVTTRPRRPAIIDYDYYVDDDDVRLVVKPELKDKLYVNRNGGIRCLDQGNFAHPTSCKKFITCAKMVNGQVIGTEYTCPDKLSFDPVGGICNWSAGLGCEEKKA